MSNQYFHNFKPAKIFSIFKRQDLKLLRDFSNNKDIVVFKPDKGRGIVIVDRCHYLDGVSRIIENNAKFEMITSEIKKFSLKIEDRINNFLLELKKCNHISNDLYGKLRVTGSGPGILYGLPKIHKPTFEADKLYRPIFAAYNVASYKLSKYLVNVLSPLSTNEFTLKNSFDFRNQIQNISNCDNLVMASFDITDLYTNVPLSETLDICMNLLANGNYFDIPSTLLRKLLELSVYDTIFCFNGSYYKQLDGLGMGLPLSPTLANIFLCYHESNWLRSCPVEFKPEFYRRYMDDTFLLFRDASHVQKFLDYLNRQHQNIKFTNEFENNKKISFLDCMVLRSENRLSTSVYRKCTFTGQGLSYFSFCAKIYKINSIKTLISRAQRVCSTFTALNKELSYLVGYFSENGYPKTSIYREIIKMVRKTAHPNPAFYTCEQKKLYASLPYFGPQAEKLKNELTAIIAQFFPQLDFKIALTNRSTISTFFQFKDELPMDLRSRIVYSYSCAQCASGTYIGSTMRSAYVRIAEHRGRSFRTGKLLVSPPHSAIRDHAIRHKHTIQDSCFKILDQDPVETSLRILESLYIGKQKPSLNNTKSCFPLQIAFL